MPAAPVSYPRTRRRVPVTAGLVAVGLLAVAGAAGRSWVAEQTDAPVAVCDPEATAVVTVTVDPTIAPAIVEATEDLGRQPLPGGQCARARVVAQDPLQTASGITTLPLAQLPDLWIPDSSTWLDRVAGDPDDPRAAAPAVPLVTLGSLASTPLIVAANPATVTALGWQSTPPTWEEVLTSGQPVALPDLDGSAAGVSALSALRQSVIERAGGDGPAQLQLALTSVANAIDAAQEQATTLEDSFGLAEAGGQAAPVVPTSYQQWFIRNRDLDAPPTVQVRPRDGSVLLDYPLVRVDRTSVGQSAAAVQAIVDVLEEAGRQHARTWGFSEPADDVLADLAAPGTTPAAVTPAPAAAPSGVPPSAAPSAVSPTTLAPPPFVQPPSQAQVKVLLEDISRLSRPSSALLVVDSSVSMRAVTESGTRATLARDAVKTSLALFPDSASVGLWFFAIGMGPGGQDHIEVVPVRKLTADAGGVTQRAALLAGTDTLVDRLTPGGTGLNDTVLAAVRSKRENYDPAAANVVVVVTDGRQEDPNGISTDELVSTLQAEADPARPVRVIAVGLAADSDAAALKTVAEATGGAAYIAERPEDFQKVLFDALRRRT